MFKLVFFLTILYALNPINVYASEFKASDTCIEVSQKFREQYLDELKQELINSFNVEITNYTVFNSHEDIEKLYDDLGSYDKRTSSLTNMLVGEYYGVKFVFINKDLNTGYIIYKNKYGNNIMERVIRTKSKWIISDVEEVKAVAPKEFDYRGFFCI
ncbi:hypothetical protein [Bacillus alkalisoli]|uniref:hypothetical protein n=1 Tax=Bacillus alkalisoli TaxID=2011008 RepID=UPI000C241DA6|nr:hypothetical protein [Bacillus alkalisoli]